MSPIVQLGPMALAADRLLAVTAVWLFVALGSSRWFGQQSGPVTWAAVAGLLAARLGFVMTHFRDFAVAPGSAFAIWEGGFEPLAGIAFAAIFLVIRVGREQRWRMLGLLATLGVAWFAIDRAAMVSKATPLSLVEVKLTTLSGEPFDPAQLERGPAVINLWADWCPPCRREMPLLAEAARTNPGTTFLFVNQGDTTDVARRLPSQLGMDGRMIVLDAGGKLSATYGGALPTTIFLARDGSVRSVHQGAISRAALSDQLKALKE